MFTFSTDQFVEKNASFKTVVITKPVSFIFFRQFLYFLSKVHLLPEP